MVVERLRLVCYTSMLICGEGLCCAVKCSGKLDFPQETTKARVEDARALYIIGLLAEHAEEECSAELLAWGDFLFDIPSAVW